MNGHCSWSGMRPAHLSEPQIAKHWLKTGWYLSSLLPEDCMVLHAEEGPAKQIQAPALQRCYQASPDALIVLPLLLPAMQGSQEDLHQTIVSLLG